MLVMEDANGRPLSLGSGFVVRNGEVASSLHVLEGSARGYARVVGQSTRYDIQGVTAIDRRRDLVVLKIPDMRAPPLPVGNSEAVQVGETVYAVGNPQGLEGTFSQGIVSGIRKVGADKLLQITAPISPGSSGGPVLNAKGEVIGTAVATFRGGQNLNFAIPSNYLRPLLASTGPSKPLPLGRATRGERSILPELGARGSEGVVGAQLSWKYAYLETGEYAFSLRNQLLHNVRDVYCLVIFYDASGNPIDVDVIRYRGVIPAGLARRVTSQVDESVQRLSRRVEFRILDFRIEDSKTETLESEDLAYRDRVLQLVRNRWTWLGKKTDLEATVRFAVKSDGEIVDVRIVQSSGDESYDESVLRAVRRARPLPPPPRGLFELEVTFRP